MAGTRSETAAEVDGRLARRALAYRWLCLGLLFAGILLAFLVRLAPAVAIPDLRAEFALGLAGAGLVTSLFMWPFALMQPLAGLAVDALGARRAVAAFLFVAALGQLMLAAAPEAGLALLGRALGGIGFATLFVGGATIMAHWFRPREFAFLTGLWTSVANIGALVAAAPLAAAILLLGWRASFALIGLAVLALAALVARFVRDRPADLGLPSPAEIDGIAPAAGPAPRLGLGEGLLCVLRNRNTWLLGGFGFTLFGTMTMTQGFFAVPYLMSVYGLDRQQVGNRLALWAVGLILGCSLWGFVAGRLLPPKGVAAWGAAVYGLLWVAWAVAPASLPPALLWLAMFWGGFFAATWIPCYALMKDSVPPEAVGTALGILNLFFWMGGAFYQQLSGLILEAFAGPAGEAPLAAYRAVIGIALASVLLSIGLMAASRRPAAAPT